MRVVIDDDRVTLDDRMLLGQGGEGRVFKKGTRAVKVFHAGSREKAEKMAEFPQGMPRGVVGPKELVRDAKTGDVVGYTMELVDGGVDAARMASRSFRQGTISNDRVCAWLRNLHALTGQVHARGVIVGDYNDGNVQLTGQVPWLIDTDSMQFGRHLCTVAHERFLDPRLFGVDLSRSQAFDEGSDWYGFAVIAFASLLFVHPYGGQHPRIPTLLRRAEARHSILRSDVAYPRAATPFTVLPDDLLHTFTRIFDCGERGVFPTTGLSPRFTVCSCGVEHARKSCPACATRVQIPGDSASSGLRATRVFYTGGRIVAAAVHGGLKVAYVDETGALLREDGTRVIVPGGEPSPTLHVAICGASTWAFDGGVAVHTCGGREIARVHGTAFDAGLAGAFVAEGDWLCDATGGARVGQVLAGTTWIRCGERFAVGFYRAGRITVGFVVRPGRGMLRVELPPIEGRLATATATFAGDRALVGVTTELHGKVTQTLLVVSEDGAVLAHAGGDPESRPLLGAIAGKCMAGDAVLSPTDDGLLLARVRAPSSDLAEAKTFEATRPYVTAGAELLAGPNGSVYVLSADRREILHLTM